MEATVLCSILAWGEGLELYSAKSSMHLSHRFQCSPSHTTNMNHEFEIFIRLWHNYSCVLARDIQLKQNQEIWGS